MASRADELEAAKKILEEWNDTLDDNAEKVKKILENTESYKNLLEQISNLKKEESDLDEELLKFAQGKASLQGREISELWKILAIYKEYRDAHDEELKLKKEIEVLSQSQSVVDQQRVLQLKEEKKVYSDIAKSKLEILDTKYGIDGTKDLQHSLQLFNKKNTIQENINNALEEENNLIKDGERAYRRQEKVIDKIHKKHVERLDNAKRGLKAIWKTTEYWQKQDSAVSKLAGTFVLNNDQVSSYRSNLLKISKDTERLYGISAEGLVKIQQGYAETTGRAIKLNETQFKDASALQKIMGEGDSTQYLADIEGLGIATEDASNKIAQIMNNSAKQGVTASKASKTFAKNLKLAENYTFKDGVDGLARMTIYSEQMKVNMQSIAQLADKISTPEGAIDAAAKLQVLGGEFAQLANPLSMMYEGLNDMEGLTDRIVKMTAGKGKFNIKTGQVDIGSMDKTFLKRAGEALGISGSEMIQMAQAQVKRNAIAQQMGNGVTDEDFKNLVQTVAQYNKKTGKFEIVDDKGVTVDVAKLTNADAARFYLPKNQEQDIHQIAMNTQGMADHLKNIDNGMKASYASGMDWAFRGIKNGIRNNLVGSNKETPWLASTVQNVGGWGREIFNVAAGFGIYKTLGNLHKKGIGLLNGGTAEDVIKNNNKPLPKKSFGKAWKSLKGIKLKGKVGMAALGIGALLTLTSGKAPGDELYQNVENDNIKKSGNDVVDILTDSNDILRKMLDTLNGKNVSNSTSITPDSNQTVVGSGLDALGMTANAAFYGSTMLGRKGREMIGNGITKIAGKTAGKGAMKFMGKVGAGPFGGIGIGVDLLRAAGNATGIVEEGSFADKAMGVGSWTATGAGLGSIFGPLGTGIGAAAGALYGLYDENKEAVNKFLSDTWEGVKSFGKGIWSVSTAPYKAVSKFISDDSGENNEVLVMIGKNVEYIASAMGNSQVYPQLKVKNFDSNFKEVAFGPKLTDVSSKMRDVSIKPIQLELSGTIKLDAGTSGKVDLKSLTKDPTFIKELTKLITNQINTNNNGGRPIANRNIPGTKSDVLK